MTRGEQAPSDDEDALHRRIDSLETDLLAQSEYYHREMQRLSEELEQLREVAAERDEAVARAKKLQKQLLSMKSSLSWKMTRPLRSLRKRVRRRR